MAVIKRSKWLILGGGGQLGTAMSQYLESVDLDFSSLKHSELDITSATLVEKTLKELSPRVVFNAAAWTDVDKAETCEQEARLVNAIGPKILARACNKVGTKLIQISTDYVFSGVSEQPWDEDQKPAPISAYGRTKAEGDEQALIENPKNTYIVRTSWLYSPWGKNFVKTMVKLALGKEGKIEVVNDQKGQPTSAIHLARQIHMLVSHDATPGIYHGTNSGETTWFHLARRVFEILGQDPERIIPISSLTTSRKARRPSYSVLGHEKWLKEGLQPMNKWEEDLEYILPEVLKVLIEIEGFDGN